MLFLGVFFNYFLLHLVVCNVTLVSFYTICNCEILVNFYNTISCGVVKFITIYCGG